MDLFNEYYDLKKSILHTTAIGHNIEILKIIRAAFTRSRNRRHIT